MKLITLNAWGGRRCDDLLRFLADKGRSTDIFCLQEVFHTDQVKLDARHPDQGLRADLFRRIQHVLPDHFGHFARFDDDPVRMGLAMFIRHGVRVLSIADYIIYQPEAPQEHGHIVHSARKLQIAVLRHGGRDLTIANYHGLWVHGPKTDTPERLLQGERIRGFLDVVGGSQIVCGDFNLLPETESLATIGRGMRNLVTEANVQSTRTPLYRHYDNPAEPNFADYILVTDDLRVRSFLVLPDQVSDHAALEIEFT